MLLLSMLAAGAAHAAQPAADPLVTQDLQCLAVFASLADENDKENEAGMTGAIMYYIGRIDVRDPNFDYRTALEQIESDKAWDGIIASQAKRCGEEMARRGSALSQIGDALTEKDASGQ